MPYDHIRILKTLFASGVWYEMTVHHHINYTINQTTITNSFNEPEEETKNDYLKQMRSDLLSSGRYQVKAHGI